MPDVPLALSLPLTGVDALRGVRIARRSQDWGYEACWTAEVQGPDAFSQLGALAVTTDLDLGVAVVPVQTRSAMVLGMTAVSLAELSQNRFSLGIGASSEVIVAGWAGQPFDRPLTQVRETFEAVRPLLSGERGTYHGDYVNMDRYRPHASPDAPIPLYLGALNQRSLEMVGALGADGLCLNQMAPHHVPALLERVRAGARADLPAGFGVVARLFCLVTDDHEAARPVVKHIFAPYIATSVYNRFYRWMGYEAEAEAVATASDRDAQAAGLSDRLIDDIFLIGNAREIAERIHAFVAAGVTVPVIAPIALGEEQNVAMLRAIARAWHDG